MASLEDLQAKTTASPTQVNSSPNSDAETSDMETVHSADKTVYKLMVYVPKKMSRFSNWVLGLGEHNTETQSRLTELGFDYMQPITVKLRTPEFPECFRCSHIDEENQECKNGCYILEDGESEMPWVRTCKAEECVGHMWKGKKKSDGDGRLCFGTTKVRLVCIDVPQCTRESQLSSSV